MGIATAAPSTEMMITRCAMDSGSSKFAITPGGAGIAPTLVPSELMFTMMSGFDQYSADSVKRAMGIVICLRDSQ